MSNIKSTIEKFKIKNYGYTAIFIAPLELKRKLYCLRPLSFGEEREEEEEEEEKQIIIINTELTFKSDQCVICLTNPPNVLFCNCRHLCIYVEYDRVKSLNTCLVCKTETTIKRNI